MPELATSEYEIVLFYNPNNPCASQTLGYAKSEDLPVRDVDILKNQFTGTQLEEIAERLGVPIQGLVNQDHTDYTKYEVVEFSDDDWIKVLLKTPQLIKEPIAIRGRKAIFIETPSDILGLSMAF